jgi:hypothetical protein
MVFRRETRLLWLYMLGSSLLVLLLFAWRQRQYDAAVQKAIAGQWVLTTAWMLEHSAAGKGDFPSCGSARPSCWDVLGPQNFPEKLERYRVEVRGEPGGYTIEAAGKEGRWVLRRGEVLRWEGVEVPVPWPRSRLVPGAQAAPTSPEKNGG